MEPFAELQFGAKSALLPSDSSSSQIAYSQSSMSICDEVEPLAKSSNLASKASFAKGSMELDYLSRHLHLIPEIAELKYQEYHHLVPNQTVDDFSINLYRDANETELPMAYVALEQGAFVGIVSLRLQDLPSHSHLTPWLGGLFVHTTRRGQGIGTFLMQQAERLAVTKGVTQLYLYTPNQAEWYLRHGWKKIDDVLLNGSPVTVMCNRNLTC